MFQNYYNLVDSQRPILAFPIHFHPINFLLTDSHRISPELLQNPFPEFLSGPLRHPLPCLPSVSPRRYFQEIFLLTQRTKILFRAYETDFS